jgi:hypothetical protein
MLAMILGAALVVSVGAYIGLVQLGSRVTRQAYDPFYDTRRPRL